MILKKNLMSLIFKLKKIVLYPQQSGKQNKYLIDAAKIFKDNDNNDYIFVFCGGW